MGLTPEEIRYLNRRLDAEWDVDRRLHLLLGGAVAAGLWLGWLHEPRWRWLSLVAANLSLWTALTGWSPLKGFLQRLGARSRAEIERERYVSLFGQDPPAAP